LFLCKETALYLQLSQCVKGSKFPSFMVIFALLSSTVFVQYLSLENTENMAELTSPKGSNSRFSTVSHPVLTAKL
jgi:hypothetical protein